MMNNSQIMGKWKEVKGEIITQWGNLTEDEVEKTTGNLTSIVGIIEQRYGEKKDIIETKLNSILAKFSDKTKEIKENM